MPKVMCPWIVCDYNSSSTSKVPGECSADKIDLTHVDTEELEQDAIDQLQEDYPELGIEGGLLSCLTMTRTRLA